MLTCVNRKPGLYKTFDEFRRNAPSLPPGSYGIVRRSMADQVSQNVGLTDLIPTGGSLSKRDLSKKIWGYCANDSVFIAKHLIEGGNGGEGFVPITDIGRYAVISYNTKEGTTPSGLGYDVQFATLDMKNGLAHYGSVEYVRQILSKDAALLQRYNREADNAQLANTHKTEITLPIIQEYNIKYAIEAN
jgi:hypothetical protein